MKITVDIPDRELRDAMRFTNARTRREAVLKILVDYNRRRRISKLVSASGTFSDAFPSNDEIEAVDDRRDASLNRLVASGRARRSGGKPGGLKPLARNKKRKTVSAAVLKDGR